ncbi:metal dependent phosphohydrolase [Thermodesulfatator indicus DSM 15286]|uniref:Metal dependent phosphohydrolase n=1 Tax=Thermodesulfatator indicus (strain DSM 15286 / JCM 11887 / CIR29812) TaxID=667014 RepID=F8AE48_THEID|nr:CRISPR-associated helicase/endonuclease Cas3 [Thermodesulfatator indicus]AEH44114.1 metal dependent phosphohydrolase [Thermodesulfatator indicus DSM 15286]
MAELLAKPDKTLREHLEKVAELARELALRLGLREDLLKRSILAALFHDLGKATRDFQRYMQLLKEGCEKEARHLKPKVFPHALASLNFVFLVEAEIFGEPFLATGAVLSHHSPLSGDLYHTWEGKPVFEKGLEELITHLLEAWKTVLGDIPGPNNFDTIRKIPPLVLLERAHERDGRKVSLRGLIKEAPRWDFARVKAVLHLADWLESSGKQSVDEIFLKDARKAVKDHFSRRKLTPYEFQRRAEESSQNGLALRAPTGSGKTEALLLWAGGAERILYLLPTQATVNAMFQRLKDIYGAKKVGIAHGHASYILHQENEEDFLWERLSSSVFAKPVTVATLDQFLLAGLQGRHWEERLTLAASANIIFDEIHSYEPYTLGLLAEALSDFPAQSLAFASATLPKALLEIFSPENLLEAEEEFFSRKRHRLSLRPFPLKEALPEIIALAQDDHRILVILNTVREAQEIYRELRQNYSDQVYLFHSRFVFRDRLEKERLVQEQRPGTILVATQVVEVSLDISYDVLFTELAPLDALVQRLGRVNRRGERPLAEVKIFTQVGEGSQRVYPEGVLKNSLSLLKDLPKNPAEREWVEAVSLLYEEIVREDSFQRDFDLGRRTLQEVREILGCYTIDLADEELRARFATRKGTPSVEVLPETLLEEAQAFKAQGEAWRLVELLVPVPIWWLHAFKGWFYPSEDLGCFVTRLPYSIEEGLLPPKKDETPEEYEFW